MVDALSVALGRAVLLDDPDLVPIAHSRQWDVDEVRSASILDRGAPAAVREALLGKGIAEARDAVRIETEEELGMEGRLCMPVRDRREALLGYVWVLDPRGELGGADLKWVRRAARDVAAVLAEPRPAAPPDEAELLAALRSADAGERGRAAAELRAGSLAFESEVVLCLLAAGPDGEDPLEAARAAHARLPAKHALAASAPEGAALLVSLAAPLLRGLPADGVAAWLRASLPSPPPAGQSAPGELAELAELWRQAAVALRVARSRPPATAEAAFAALGADRVIAQLPPTVLADLPEPLLRLLREDPVLAETLETFLDAGGDVKRAAAALSLHRSGLYYRLRRIEDLSGLDLASGEDRLLAQLAARAVQMF